MGREKRETVSYVQDSRACGHCRLHHPHEIFKVYQLNI